MTKKKFFCHKKIFLLQAKNSVVAKISFLQQKFFRSCTKRALDSRHAYASSEMQMRASFIKNVTFYENFVHSTVQSQITEFRRRFRNAYWTDYIFPWFSYFYAPINSTIDYLRYDVIVIKNAQFILHLRLPKIIVSFYKEFPEVVVGDYCK